MSAHRHLPLLPLMLAGLPPRLEQLLAAVGVPAAPLPRAALLAEGTGRFLLFDSRSGSSQKAARQASRQGLIPLDVTALAAQAGAEALLADEPEPTASPAAPNRLAQQAFLGQLKLELESRGGVWLRVSTHPYPFRMASTLLVDYGLSAKRPTTPIPSWASVFVSTRLREEELTSLVRSGVGDVGWSILPDDVESSGRKTASHWTTRKQRFDAAGVRVVGGWISANVPRGVLPGHDTFTRLGHEFLFAEPGDPYISGVDTLACLRLPPQAAGPVEQTMSAATAGQSAWRLDSSHVLSEHDAHAAPWRIDVGAMEKSWRGDEETDALQAWYVASPDWDACVNSHELVAAARRATFCWSVSLTEFANWQRARLGMRVHVWPSAEGLEIHVDWPQGHAGAEFLPPGLEIWRGAHLAAIPVSAATMWVRDCGLPYVNQAIRTPWGSQGARGTTRDEPGWRLRDRSSAGVA